MDKKTVIKKIASVIEEIASLNRTLFSEGEQVNQLTIDYLRTNTQYLLELVNLLATQPVEKSNGSVKQAVEQSFEAVVEQPVVMVKEEEVLPVAKVKEELPTSTKSIHSFIGLNDRLLLIKELFDGNKDVYEEVLNQLNETSAATDAEALLNSYGTGNPAWDEQEDLVKYFKYVAKRRFTE